MKILKPKHNFDMQIEGHNFPVKSGREYISTDYMASILIEQGAEAAFEILDFKNEKKLITNEKCQAYLSSCNATPESGGNCAFDCKGTGIVKFPNIDYTNKKILVSRTAGIGDFFFILRSITEIKKNFENVYVTFACGVQYKSLLSSMFPNLINEVVALPFSIVEYNRCDYFFTFEGIVEANPIAKKENIFEIMAKEFRVNIGADHHVDIYVNNGARLNAEAISKDWTRPLIGIQFSPTTLMRTYPTYYIKELVKAIDKMGYDTLALGTAHELISLIKNNPYMDDVRDKIRYEATTDAGFELSVALASKCKLLIVPDSCFAYIGDSLGIPTIGLYGPFSSQLRVKGLNVYAIENYGKCQNCQEHTPLPCIRSIQDEYSPCLKAIYPDVIINAIKIILKENENKIK